VYNVVLTEDRIKKLDEMVSQDTESNEEIKALLTKFKTAPREIEVFGIKLKVIPTIPRNLRKEIAKFESMYNDIEATEEHTYRILSKICVDPPFNSPETWEYLDEKTGTVPEIMREIFNEAYNLEKKIKKFRGE